MASDPRHPKAGRPILDLGKTRALMDRKCVSVDALAGAIGVTPPTLRSLLKGNYECGGPTVKRIADALGEPLDRITL